MRIAIVGAGMAGLACAEALRAAAHDVVLFDKGARPGGRMSTKIIPTPLGDASFDYGAQYFVARTPALRAIVDRWEQDNIVAPWPAAGADAWVGVPGMSAPLIAMASHGDVRWSARVETLARRSDGWHLRGARVEADGFDAVVVAAPAEQAAPLVRTFDPRLAAAADSQKSDPCWTVMAAFSSDLPIAADVIEDAGVIGWAARNTSKPGRTAVEAWVIQASPGWSVAHLEDDGDAVTTMLLDAFARTTGVVAQPIATSAHRWRYARSARSDQGCLWNGELALGLCGDWLSGPRVEAAWQSGTALAAAMIAA